MKEEQENDDYLERKNVNLKLDLQNKETLGKELETAEVKNESLDIFFEKVSSDNKENTQNKIKVKQHPKCYFLKKICSC